MTAQAASLLDVYLLSYQSATIVAISSYMEYVHTIFHPHPPTPHIVVCAYCTLPSGEEFQGRWHSFIHQFPKEPHTAPPSSSGPSRLKPSY